MNGLIEHLNSIDGQKLLSFQWMTPELAERLIAARPFTAKDDLLKVEGVTTALLEKWMTDLSRDEKTQSVSATPVTVSEPGTGKKGSTGRVIARVLIALIILAALAATAYYGIPYFREKVLNPLESNTSRVGELAATQSADSARLQGDLSTLQNEVAGLQEQVATLQIRADNASESIESQSASLEKLDALQATLQAQLKEQNADILMKLDEQLTLTRALELLSRSRLYLSQNNFGMARNDISAARDLLFPLLETTNPQQIEGLRVVIDRLDMALANLPAYPVVAVYDVDTAWQLLVDGLPAVPVPVVTPLVTTQVSPSVTPDAFTVTPPPQEETPTAPSATP